MAKRNVCTQCQDLYFVVEDPKNEVQRLQKHHNICDWDARQILRTRQNYIDNQNRRVERRRKELERMAAAALRRRRLIDRIRSWLPFLGKKEL